MPQTELHPQLAGLAAVGFVVEQRCGLDGWAVEATTPDGLRGFLVTGAPDLSAADTTLADLICAVLAAPEPKPVGRCPRCFETLWASL